jgi:CBS domain-containing protein/anti-sigma regulatory factor (Ser/Thr protein kinase)
MGTGQEARRVVTDEAAGHISRVEELSYELKIGDVMTRDVHTLTPDMEMIDALRLFRKYRISGAPVVADGEMIGIISIEDLLRAVEHCDLHVPVRDFMTTQLVTIHWYEPVVKALELFGRASVGRLPVVDENGKMLGLLTKGSITTGTLRALQKDFQEEEVRRYRASHLFQDIISDRTSLILRYHIEPRDFTHGGQASNHIKRALLRLGANAQLARRCGIAIYEAEMNLIIHTTSGGVIWVEIESDHITMATMDDGPGIPDVDLARRPGWSTATAEVREMGFGAGMGLKNIERCVDEMNLDSKVGEGTRLDMKIVFPPEETFGDTNPAAAISKG